MSFKIAICDDDLRYCNNIKEILEANAMDYINNYEIHMYNSGVAVLQAMSNGFEADVVFMDIQMKEMNGLSAAEQIRGKYKNTSVVLVTQFIDFVMEGYKVNAFRYILKDDQKFEREIAESLKQVYYNKQRELNQKQLYVEDVDLWISTKDIVYIESDLHDVKIHIIIDGKEKIIVNRANIAYFDTVLDNGFFIRIHQSYIVNCRFVLGMTKEYVILYDNTYLSIARRRYKETVRVYMRYKGQEI